MAGLTDITKNGTQYEFMPRSTAGQFSTSTAYAVGDYCYFDGTLYRCTTAHAAGAFVSSHFTAVTIDGELKEKEAEIEDVKTDLNYNFPVESLIPLSSSENTFNGITITCENGIITPVGTATASGGRLAHIIDLPNVKAGTYTVSAFPTGNRAQLTLYVQNVSNSIITSVKNGSNTFTLDADANLYIGANTDNGKTYGDPVGVTLVSGSTAPTEFIDPRKRNVVDTTARSNYAKTVHIMDSNGGLTDANNAEINRIYLFISVSDISNLPVAIGGTLITFARSTEVKMQMYMSSSHNLYIRNKWGINDWSAWRQLITDYSVSTLPTRNMMAMPDNDSLTDANDAIINRVYLLINVSNVSNLPESTAGTLITFARDSSAVFQMYITSTNARFWFRRKWGTNGWSDWRRVATLSDIIDYPLDVLPMFDNITCCGDSLTYSQVYTAESTSRQAKVPYPKVLEKITGTPTTMYATAGYTAIQWWNAYHENITQKTNQVAIVYLGTNAGLTDTIDTDAPGTDVANYDKTTNTGAYCSIVKSFLDVGAKVILVKLYASYGNKDTTNSVIKKIADKFSCGLAESAYLSDNVYHYFPDLSSYNSVHYNDIGYSAFARKLADNIANMDKDYLKFIIPD